MQDTVWLICTRQKVERMNKSQPGRLDRTEIAVKVVVTIDHKAFQPPVLEREITVSDWREGLDFADVDLKEGTITEAEAELIRQGRLAQMIETLTARGYSVEPPAPEDGADGLE